MSRIRKNLPRTMPGVKVNAIRVLCPKCQVRKMPLDHRMCAKCEYAIYQKGKSKPFTERTDHEAILISLHLKRLGAIERAILKISDHCSCCDDPNIEFLTILKPSDPATGQPRILCFNCAHSIRVYGDCVHQRNKQSLGDAY